MSVSRDSGGSKRGEGDTGYVSSSIDDADTYGGGRGGNIEIWGWFGHNCEGSNESGEVQCIRDIYFAGLAQAVVWETVNI